MKNLKIIVEKHSDGYVAYPLGAKGACVAQGDTYEEALANSQSALAFHIETFGSDALEDQDDLLEAFIAEASVAA